MKGIDLFCTSPASTAICVSVDHRSIVQHEGGKAIDRHNPLLLDRRRTTPFISQTPSSSSSTSSTTSTISTTTHTTTSKPPKTNNYKHHKTKTKKPNSSKLPTTHDHHPHHHHRHHHELFSPPGSSRYLLSSNVDSSSLFSDASALVPVEQMKFQSLNKQEFKVVPLSALVRMDATAKSESLVDDESASAILNSSSNEQVVVLRVSLHCKGCEAKVRKHLSRMQGVKSFNIDFQAKKVTVVGNVTPSGVLNSISKVKNAQLLPTPSPSS